ncbi:hypothetical protein BD309DRAFT_548968 [Dichomitus squalens]|nr:hypothetical protein BD309DRAFT_548968 [Dichomitus squalens]
MPLISVSVDAFLVLAACILTPTFLVFRRQPQSTRLSLDNALSAVLILHSLFILYTVLVRWPPNIFQRLKIPLTAPSETIRAVLLQRAGLPQDATLPRPLDSLLTRLSSFDTRTHYVRFGQSVIQDCEHCTTFDEYAIFTAPRMALGYIRECAVAGIMTISGSGHEKWRTYAVGVIVGAFILEGYWLATTPIRIPHDGMNVFMWYDNLWLARHAFFLLLPLLIRLLPRAPLHPTPVPILAAAQLSLSQTHQRLSTARFVHAAMQRQPALRGAASEWWERQRAEGEIARADEGVRRAAEKLGKGIEEGAEGAAGRGWAKMRDVVRQMLEMLALALPSGAVAGGEPGR